MLLFAADLLRLCYQKKPSFNNQNYLKTELSKKTYYYYFDRLRIIAAC